MTIGHFHPSSPIDQQNTEAPALITIEYKVDSKLSDEFENSYI